MRFRRAGIVLLGAALAVFAACGFGNLDGLTGGAGDAGPAPNDAAPDVAADVSTLPPSDAGVDATIEASCPMTTVALCEDFHSDEHFNDWLTTTIAGGTFDFLSAPSTTARALIATVPDTTAGATPSAYWQKSYSAVVSKLSVDLDMGFTQYSQIPDEFHIVSQIQLDHGDSFSLIYVDVLNANSGFVLQEFTPDPGNIDSRGVNMAPGAIHHLHYDVQIGGRTHLAVDGTTQLDFATDDYILAGKPTIRAGVAAGVVPGSNVSVATSNIVFSAE